MTTMRLKWAFWDILRHFEIFWDNSEDFLTSLDHLDCFPSHFRPFSSIIGSFKNPRTKGPTDGRTDGRTDRPSYRDAWTHLKRTGAEMWKGRFSEASRGIHGGKFEMSEILSYAPAEGRHDMTKMYVVLVIWFHLILSLFLSTFHSVILTYFKAKK